jgi:hypothetical protein
MLLADKSNWVSISCSLALLTMVGCGSQSNPAPTSASPSITFPQTSASVVVDPAHAQVAGATIAKTYDDRTYGKTEVRSDDYIRHADSVSPTGWTPWHYRTAPHNWTEPMSYDSSISGTWTAKVQSVNMAKREITLQGPSGKSETFEVGSKVQRLNEVSAGDTVKLAWSATLHGELRAPTPAEAADPIRIYSYVSRNSTDAAPEGVEGTALRVVTTVDAVDLAAMTVTLKGPLGNRIDAHAKSPENIRKLHVGDTVVVTYSQGVVISLEKA